MTFNPRKALYGLLLGLGGHALAVAAGFIAARVVEPSAGGGFEDLAAAALMLVGVEAVAGLLCLISGIALLVKGRRDLGGGILVGWLLGLIAITVLIRAV